MAIVCRRGLYNDSHQSEQVIHLEFSLGGLSEQLDLFQDWYFGQKEYQWEKSLSQKY